MFSLNCLLLLALFAVSVGFRRSLQLVTGNSVMHSMTRSADNTDKKTFKRFMEIELWRNPEIESLYPVLCSIESACSDINRLMRRVSTDDIGGYYRKKGSEDNISVNVQGEDQKKLDVIANRIMKTSLCCTGKVSLVASEEDDEACLCSDVTDNAAFSGDFVAVFDPLGNIIPKYMIIASF